jgi:hypothetical protein
VGSLPADSEEGSGGGGGTGASGVGGSTGVGGSEDGLGGSDGTGGTLGSGGAGDGGMTGTAGGSGAGGSSGSGGRSGTGGGPGTGGGFGTGGVSGTGGRAGTGGSTGSVCTSMMTYTGGTGPTMEPGVSCNSCHNHAFTIFGTVYPTAHEPNLCDGDGSNGLQVVVTGADGRSQTLTPSTAGNFYSNSAVASPFTAKVTKGGASRAMVASQTSGDCNSCHTQNGANGAPGRIMSP